MDELIPLQIPEQQLTIDHNALSPAADGFNYPNLRLLNKQARVSISLPLSYKQDVCYQALAVSNACGWFAAIRVNDIILSPLADLRTRISSARSEDKSIFVPKRTLRVALGKPCILAFGSRDSRLFVGLEEGHILTYDTAFLFSEGAQEVSPAHTFQSPNSGPIRQILPNPGAEPNLVDICAIVSSDNKIRLLNAELDLKGGWVGPEPGLEPVAVSWSPKGKHLAIGLRSGHILTYSLSNSLTPNKHFPPTSTSSLQSLSWLGPGHTFKVTYSPPEDGSEAAHHIITIDPRSSLATYYSIRSPYCLPGRSSFAYSIAFPRWDAQFNSAEEMKVLLILGDSSSTELEILGQYDNRWYQQSLENPISLPLDENMEDTTLLALEADLTDTQVAPVVYAYLNDGTIQAWHVEHTVPYIGITSTMIARTPSQTDSIQMDDVKAVPFNQLTASMSSDPDPQTTFKQEPETTVTGFGSTTFGTQNITRTSTTFGSLNSSFGVIASLTPTSTDIVSMTREASMSDSTSSFGGLSLGNASTDEATKSTNGLFGSFTNTTAIPTPAFGSGVAPAAGFGAFSDFRTTPTDSASTQQSQTTSELNASGQAPSHPLFSKPTFGQSTFGQPSFGRPSVASNASLPGGPSGGFGAFASRGPVSFGGSSSSSGFSQFASGNPISQSSGVTPAATNQSLFSAHAQSPFAPSGITRSPFATNQSMQSLSSPFGSIEVTVNAPSMSPTDTSAPAEPKDQPSFVHIPPSEAGNSKEPHTPGTTSTFPGTPTASGAFSNLKTTPSLFRPATGFGAFDNTSPSTSPFFNARDDKVTKITAFAADPPITNNTPGGTVHSSATKSVFGLSGFAAPTSTPHTISTGATGFAAFSGTSGGFSAFSGISKSFGDLSRDVKDKSQSAVSPFSTPSPLRKEEKPQATSSIPGTLSQPEDSASDREGEGIEEESGGEDILSQGSGSSDSDTDDGDLEEVSVPSRSPSPRPEDVLLPPSPSTTPKFPRAPVPSAYESPSTESPLQTVLEEEGTTPPSSPIKASAPPAVPSPLPTTNIPLTPSLGTGFVRLSTKPTRSSPLAANPFLTAPDKSLREPQILTSLTSQPSALTLGSTPSDSQTYHSRTPPLSSKIPSAMVGPPEKGAAATSLGLSISPMPQATSSGPLTMPSFSFGNRLNSPPTASSGSMWPSPPSGSFEQIPPNRDAAGIAIPKPDPTAAVFNFPSNLRAPTLGSLPTAPAKTPAPANELSWSPSPGGTSYGSLTSSQKPGLEKTNLEEGMQKECVVLVQMMARELEQLQMQSQNIIQKTKVQKSFGSSKKQADFFEPERWGHRDAVHFGVLLKLYEQDLSKIKEQHEHQRACAKELRSGMLKAGTRKEEISRFKKANSDQEFSKMLKLRTLGPEHLETQIQLRRKIRAMKDRIQQLEDHLQSSKKRISEVTSGRPSLKAPSLDTVNRTYRNIDIAIQHQFTDVSKLAMRISKLDLTSRPNHPERDPRLPDRVLKQQYHITPHVATTTAAALNAERSAHKLKRALLKVRLEPLLNTTAAMAPAAAAFNTPRKLDGLPPFALQPAPAPSSDQVQGMEVLDFSSLSDDHFNPSTPIHSRRGAGTGSKRHQSVPLRRGTGTTPPPSTSFDWGPLPEFNGQSPSTMIKNVHLVPIIPTAPPSSRLPTGFVPLTRNH